MIIYIDENLPPAIAEGFNILQVPENFNLNIRDHIEVRSLKSAFGPGVEDEDWIPEAGKHGACVITQDYNIRRIRHQRELCLKFNLGMFYFRPPSNKGYSYWEMVQQFVKHWPEIIKVVSKNKRPFSYKITPRSRSLERMDD